MVPWGHLDSLLAPHPLPEVSAPLFPSSSPSHQWRYLFSPEHHRFYEQFKHREKYKNNIMDTRVPITLTCRCHSPIFALALSLQNPITPKPSLRPRFPYRSPATHAHVHFLLASGPGCNSSLPVMCLLVHGVGSSYTPSRSVPSAWGFRLAVLGLGDGPAGEHVHLCPRSSPWPSDIRAVADSCWGQGNQLLLAIRLGLCWGDTDVAHQLDTGRASAA